MTFFFNTQAVSILKMEGNDLLLKYLIFGYFGLTNVSFLVFYDVIKHQKAKYLDIIEKKYLSTWLLNMP